LVSSSFPPVLSVVFHLKKRRKKTGKRVEPGWKRDGKRVKKEGKRVDCIFV